MSKFTKGPWEAYEQADECWSIEGDGDTLCDLFRLEETTHDHIEFDNAEANARLIAAAPEMYEIIKNLSLGGKVGGCGTDEEYLAIVDELSNDSYKLLARIEGGA